MAAAADAVRLEGLIPPSMTEGNRVLVYRVPRGVAGVISPWKWPYTMPGEIVAPARVLVSEPSGIVTTWSAWDLGAPDSWRRRRQGLTEQRVRPGHSSESTSSSPLDASADHRSRRLRVR